jgi:3(or 17)beta-hydroxysteroid dehydrogenase
MSGAGETGGVRAGAGQVAAEQARAGRVAGKVALVSGAASGLGRATARRLVAEGARVAIADIDREGGDAVARELGDAALFVPLDVTEAGAWDAAVARTVEAFGRIDVLVNNAGVVMLGDVETLSLEDWRRVHAVNLDGVFLGCKYGIGAMRRSGGGSIVNLSSVSGLVGGHNMAAYNSSKGGVRLLTKSVALHCARAGYGIRCNSIHPTFIDTAMLDAMLVTARDPAGARAKLARQVPLGVIGEPDDVAHLVVYLASDESKFVTGAEFVVDGGLTAQ